MIGRFFLLALVLQGGGAVQLPPAPRGFSAVEADMVVDAAGVLSPDAIARLNSTIFDLKSRYGGEIVVVTLPDIQGREAADVALRIGRDWRVGAAAEVGDRARNSGVVVLVIPKETASDNRGQIAIQTGRGTEGFITDGVAGEIRRTAIPYFQRADYSGALELVTSRLAERWALEFGDDSTRQALGRREGGRVEVKGQSLLFGLLVLVIVLFVLSNAARGGGMRGCLYALLMESLAGGRRHRRGGWGGWGFGGGSWGGGGGGFGGFGGGGGFSGGGSSGSW
ncbi:MAG: TPM domain-containing protein [Gemmatimonadota bacterium]